VLTVFTLVKLDYFQLGFLWLNPIGAFGVILFSLIFHFLLRSGRNEISFKEKSPA